MQQWRQQQPSTSAEPQLQLRCQASEPQAWRCLTGTLHGFLVRQMHSIHIPRVDHCKLQPRQCWQPAKQQVEQARTVMFQVSGMSELLTCKAQ